VKTAIVHERELTNREAGTAGTGAGPAITCSSCRYFHLNHEDLPDHRRTGHHGLCISPFQPRHAQHEGSVRCAWWERREGPVRIYKREVAFLMGIDEGVDEYTARVLLVGDEELIAEIERRGYRVPCPECGTMQSVPPGEAGRTVTCDFCGEGIDTAPLSPAKRGFDAFIAGTA
jgi:ribosomal protein S27E